MTIIAAAIAAHAARCGFRRTSEPDFVHEFDSEGELHTRWLEDGNGGLLGPLRLRIEDFTASDYELV